MPKPTQAEIDLSLHRFGQQMREAWAERQQDFEKNFAAFQDGIREGFEQERTPLAEPTIEAPKIEGPSIEGPKIEPPAMDTRDVSEPDR